MYLGAVSNTANKTRYITLFLQTPFTNINFYCIIYPKRGTTALLTASVKQNLAKGEKQ